MKTLNAKRIAAVVAGAALLGVGLAFAGPITFQNVPIISNSGQPVVQIVIGSKAQAWDGVTAANIAAAIGNLAYTSVPVTASVNATQANKVLHVSVSSSSYTLSNQQVWLNESGAVGATAGTYLFSALIGSVLNGAVILNSPQNTKTLQGNGQYCIPTFIHYSDIPSCITIHNCRLRTSINISNTEQQRRWCIIHPIHQRQRYDNVMQITASQFNNLVSNFGGSGETTSLWLTGFPVFDQGSAGSPVNQFMLLDAGGAYQATFSNPIQNSIANGQLQINTPIRLLGQNWTILNATGPSTTVTSANTVAGGKLFLASALVPLQTIYVGHNLTSGPWTVQLTDLGQPNSNGLSPASLSILYNNVLTNTSSVPPGNNGQVQRNRPHIVRKRKPDIRRFVRIPEVGKTAAVHKRIPITNGKVFNQTTNPGWFVNLLWTNTTSTTAANAKALQSIIIYNVTPTNLAPGQSFNFIQNPQRNKVTFLGDTLGASNFDSVTVGIRNNKLGAIPELGNASRRWTWRNDKERNRAGAAAYSNITDTERIQLCRTDGKQRTV